MKQVAGNLQRILSEVSAQFSEIYSVFAQRISEPDVVGWIELLRVLEEATKNEKIMASPEASAFLKLMLQLAGESSIGSSADNVIEPLKAEFISKNSSEISKKRFEKTREAQQWVISEWVKHKAEYQGNKTAFARDYAKRIFHERDLIIQERTIRERWLKGL